MTAEMTGPKSRRGMRRVIEAVCVCVRARYRTTRNAGSHARTWNLGSDNNGDTRFFFFCSFFSCGSLLLLVFVRLCGDFYFPACSACEVSNCFVVLYIHIKRWTDSRARTFFFLPFATNRVGSFFFCKGSARPWCGDCRSAVIYCGAKPEGFCSLLRRQVGSIVRTTHPEPPQRTCRKVFALSALLRDVSAGHRTKIGLV